jgi:TM2 domain-containing membrane protein YozV
MCYYYRREVRVVDESRYDPHSNEMLHPDHIAKEWHTPSPMPHAKIKSELSAVVLSILLPGLGQIYNGQITKGILTIIILVIILGVLFQLSFLFSILSIVIWYWSIFDAYDIARRINQGLIRK